MARPRAARLFVGAAAIAAIAAVFLLVANASVATSHFTTRMTTEVLPRGPLPPGTLYLEVVAPPRLQRPLEQALEKQLRPLLGANQRKLVITMPGSTQRPKLTVGVTGEVHWLAFTAEADLTARYLVQAAPPVGPIATAGSVEVRDTTRGVITRPAYDAQLAQQLAALLALELESTLGHPIGSPAPGK